MGNDYTKKDIDDKPEHKVTVNSFMISKYELTNEMFLIFCMHYGYPIPYSSENPNEPVMTSWEGAIKYCSWLSIIHGYEKVYSISVDSTGLIIKNINFEANGFRLATEAEWEYAVKGGKKSQGYAYCGSNGIEEVTWYKNNSNNERHNVGEKKPNELGIYDMVGNVSEWCNDYYSETYYNNSPKNNPQGPETGNKRVHRGGNYLDTLSNLRLTKRAKLEPAKDNNLVGLRLVRGCTEEYMLYNRAKIGSITICNSYLSKYPKGLYVEEIIKRKSELVEAQRIAQQNRSSNNNNNQNYENTTNKIEIGKWKNSGGSGYEKTIRIKCGYDSKLIFYDSNSDKPYYILEGLMTSKFKTFDEALERVTEILNCN